MRATVPELTAARAGVARIDVGQLSVGPATIERLVVRNVRFAMSAGVGQLRNFRITIRLTITLTWTVSVDLLFDDFTRSGTWEIGRPSIPFGFGNVTLPGLNSLTVNLTEMTAQNLTASSGPIANLNLGAAIAEQIRAQSTSLPATGFGLTGLGLVALRGEGVTVPDATVSEVGIGRISGGNVPIPSLAIPNVAFPNTAVGEIRSRDVDVRAVGQTVVFNAGGGLLRISLRVIPEAHVRIAEMILTNINASTSIGSIVVENVVLPYEVLDLRLADVGINNIEIPAFEVT